MKTVSFSGNQFNVRPSKYNSHLTPNQDKSEKLTWSFHFFQTVQIHQFANFVTNQIFIATKTGLLCPKKRKKSFNIRGTAKKTRLQPWATNAQDKIRPNTNDIAKL